MKFLLVASDPDYALNFRGHLLSSLINLGIEVHLAMPIPTAKSAACEKLSKIGISLHPIRLQRTNTNPIADFFTLFDLLKLMKIIQPDYVLGYTIKPVIYGMLAARLASVPKRFALITGLGYAFTGNSKELGARNLLRSLVKRLYATALRHADKVFFQNEDDELLFRSIGILNSNTPSFIINGSGVDLSQYAVAPLPEKSHFLLIARLLGDKGVREYIQAARKVRLIHPEVKFSLVGWIDANPDAISSKELSDWIDEGIISYLGRMNDVRPAIRNCSVYVLPSYREGTPRTVLEAMAMGRAIITTDAPGCRETVVDGYNGILVPIKAIDELASAMLQLIEKSALVSQMGIGSRKIAEEKYDVRKVNSIMLHEMGLISN